MQRLAVNVRIYHDGMPSDACDLVSAIVSARKALYKQLRWSIEALLQRLRAVAPERAVTAAKGRKPGRDERNPSRPAGAAKEEPMANREQKGDREKKKPKKTSRRAPPSSRRS